MSVAFTNDKKIDGLKCQGDKVPCACVAADDDSSPFRRNRVRPSFFVMDESKSSRRGKKVHHRTKVC